MIRSLTSGRTIETVQEKLKRYGELKERIALAKRMADGEEIIDVSEIPF